jgi:hypothetical protein
MIMLEVMVALGYRLAQMLTCDVRSAIMLGTFHTGLFLKVRNEIRRLLQRPTQESVQHLHLCRSENKAWLVLGCF